MSCKGKRGCQEWFPRKGFPEAISLSPQRWYVYIFPVYSHAQQNMFEPLHGQDGVSKPHRASSHLLPCPSFLVWESLLARTMPEAEKDQLGLCVQVHFSEPAVGKILFDWKLV